MAVEKFKRYQRRSFWIITVFMLVISGAVGAGIYHGLARLGTAVVSYPANDLPARIPQLIVLMQDQFTGWVLLAVAGSLLVTGWFLWLVLRLGTAPVFAGKEPKVSSPFPSVPPRKDFLDQKIEQERRQRLFLQTLSVLQREGRLLDFFDEELGRYSDEQIGAAVRSIQADCKQAVKKYIDPRPVVAADEGELITIGPGFDMNAITLVGHVTGDPPFEGIVRHRGWKAGKKEVPKLVDIQDPTIITPAEIELGVRS